MMETKEIALKRNWSSISLVAAALLFGLSLAACGKSSPGAGGAQAPGATAQAAGGMKPEAAKKEAKDIYTNRCVPCHGTYGAGDGPASAGLTPKPRDFRSPEWQKSVTDEHIEKAIKLGGAAVGKSAAMPGNPDLNSKPEVVAALRAYVRKLEQK